MNKKQFNTAGHGVQSNHINPTRHKFSNIIEYSHNISNGSQSGMNLHNHHTNVSNNTNKTQSQKGRMKLEANRGEGNEKREGSKLNKNPRIHELQEHNNKISANQQDVRKQNTHNQSEETKITPVFVGYQNNRMSEQNSYNKKGIQTIKIQQKCVICGTSTDKCCGLCRKVFYCSSEHQQKDWHSSHKFECQGRTQVQQQINSQSVEGEKYRTNNTNKFYFDSNSVNKAKQNNGYEQEMDYQAIHRFLELLEQRLIIRSKIMSQAAKINERTASIVRESLVKQAEELLELSERITHQQFKPSFSRKITKKDILQYSSQQWGSQIVVSENGVALQYYADLVLMAKLYHLCGLLKQARQEIIAIGRLLEDPEQKKLFLSNQLNKHFSQKKPNLPNDSSPISYGGNQFNSGQNYSTSPGQEFGISRSRLGKIEDPLQNTKYLILQSILQLSEFYNIDKTSQSVYKLFIKKIEIEQGIWEQVYAYFNIGSWYMKKTYFDKSVKAFTYSLQLLDSHRKGIAESVIFKSDCLFNIAQGYWALGERQFAIQNMQQSYRIRANSIGKNSMQCSYCLFSLAKWYKEMEKWSQCVQYIDQCMRIRKLYENQPNFQGKLEQIKSLIAEVYKIIKIQKKRTQISLDPKTEKYFSILLQKQKEQQKQLEQKKIQENKLLPQGTVASRLFRDDKEYVKFKVNISLQLWNTISSSQAKLLGDLLQRGDQKMEKSQAIRILIESPFVLSLNADQRQQFIAENKIEKLHENQ